MTRLALAIAALVIALDAQAATRRLIFRHYTTADGLSQDQVSGLATDAEGFLWIATVGGLDRFDGERFTRFGASDGLRGRNVDAVATGRDGTCWVATEVGLFVARPGEANPPGQMFREV